MTGGLLSWRDGILVAGPNASAKLCDAVDALNAARAAPRKRPEPYQPDLDGKRRMPLDEDGNEVTQLVDEHGRRVWNFPRWSFRDGRIPDPAPRGRILTDDEADAICERIRERGRRPIKTAMQLNDNPTSTEGTDHDRP